MADTPAATPASVCPDCAPPGGRGHPLGVCLPHNLSSWCPGLRDKEGIFFCPFCVFPSHLAFAVIWGPVPLVGTCTFPPASVWRVVPTVSATRPSSGGALRVPSFRFQALSAFDQPTDTRLVLAEWVHGHPTPVRFFCFLTSAVTKCFWAAFPGGAGGGVRGTVAGTE